MQRPHRAGIRTVERILRHDRYGRSSLRRQYEIRLPRHAFYLLNIISSNPPIWPHVVSVCSEPGEVGEILCFSAPSGYGKTTVLRCLAELIAYEGTVKLRDVSASQMGVPKWRTRVQYVPQRAGLMSGTPMEYWNLVNSYSVRRDGRTLTDEDPVKIGLQWNLPQRTWDESWQTISGGERQRVVLAISLALNPDILLLDEPTSALDEVTAKLVERTLLDRQVTAIWISHDANQIKRVATRTLVLG